MNPPTSGQGYFESAKRFLTDTFYLLLGLQCVISALALIILSVPIYIFRLIVFQLAKYFRPDLGLPLDQISVTMSPDIYCSTKPPRCTIIGVTVVDGNLDLSSFQQLVLSNCVLSRGPNRELKYHQMSHYPVSWLGFMFWKKDKQFDIQNHIYSHQNQDGSPSTDKDLNKLVEELLNAPYHPTRSPWEFHLLQDYLNPSFHPGKMCVMICKVHHTLGDGHSIMGVFAEEVAGQGQFQLPKVRLPQRTSWEKLVHTVTVPFTGTLELARILQENFKDSPLKIPDGEKVWHQLYAKSGLIPIKHIKHIKDTFRVSFTSVLLSSISHAIHKNLVGKKLNNSLRVRDYDDSINCISVLPLPAKSRSGKIANHATGAIFRIPAGSFGSPLDRLRECHAILERTKNSVLPAALAWFIKCMASNFYWVSRLVTRNRGVATGLTNFPTFGNDFQGAVLGRKTLFSDFAVGGLEGVSGLGFMVASGRGSVRIAATTEQGLMTREETNDLVKLAEEEIQRLYSLSLSLSISNGNKMENST